MPMITTFLSYDSGAQEAAELYVPVFPNSRINRITRYGAAGPGAPGSVMTVAFELDGREFMALNGGPHFRFTDGVSLAVTCETQEEIDAIWSRLTEGGEEVPCGWLKDRFGFWWQVTPSSLGEMLADTDPERSRRVMVAMVEMKKISIAELERAYEGSSTQEDGDE